MDIEEKTVRIIGNTRDHSCEHWDGGFSNAAAQGADINTAKGPTDLLSRRIRLLPQLTDSDSTILVSTFIDELYDAVIIRDLEDRICFWNKGAERIYGWRADEVAGRNVYEVLFPNNMIEFGEPTCVLSKTGEWSGELRQLTKGRRELVVESRWKLQRDGSGQPESVLMINRDVTQTKLLNATLLRAQRIETAGRLATSIAHDLNQVLSILLMTMRSLPLDQIDDHRVHKASQSCAEHAKELITQLLSITNETSAEPAPLDLAHLVDEIANVLRSTFPRSIEIKLAVAPDLWPIEGIKMHLYQLLLNLSLNARDAMASGGTLTIGANNLVLDKMTASSLGKAPGSYVLVTVADTGTGIPEEIATKIFEPFFTTKEPGQGMGLGLFTVASIVKNHGGFINLAAKTERGAQFMAYLPAKTVEKSLNLA